MMGYSPERSCDERRRGPDRRTDLARAFVHSLYRNRRRGMRRIADQARGHYVDAHGPGVIVCAVTVLLLSCADSLFTLLLLQRGAEEVNPVMRALIEADDTLFVGVKLALTAACLVFLVAHRNFRLFRVQGHTILYASLGAYLILVNYQWHLLAI